MGGALLLPPLLWPRPPNSVNLLHLSDDLLLVDGQYGVVLAHLFKHHATVKLVANLLKVIPGEKYEISSWRLAQWAG